MKRKKISVVIPCYNGGKFIRQNIEKINDYLVNNFLDYEIIIVNDGSFDDTREKILQIEKNLPKLVFIDNEINFGKGHAVKKGVLKSRYEIVMFLDADLAMPIEGLKNFVKTIEEGFDIAIASRFVPGLRVIKPILWYRQFMEKTFRLLRMVITHNYSIQDTQCGFKLFSAKSTEFLFRRLYVYGGTQTRKDAYTGAFDVELLFLARKNRYKIKELPIVWKHAASDRVSPIKDSLRMLRDIVQIRLAYLTHKYDKTK